jgi:hypothetical protein
MVAPQLSGLPFQRRHLSGPLGLQIESLNEGLRLGELDQQRVMRAFCDALLEFAQQIIGGLGKVSQRQRLARR